MITEDNTAAPRTEQLTVEVTATGVSSPSGYDIAPEHQHHADAILAIDPINGVSTPHEIPEGWGTRLTLRATALADPKMRRAVEDKLNALGKVSPEQRSAKEAEFTADIIRSNRAGLIAKIGLGRDATPYHREMANIANEVEDLYRQHDVLQGELERVLRYDTETDAVTGAIKPVPVYAVVGARAKAYVDQQQDLLRRARLLYKDDGTPGIEGALRAKQALAESVAARVELQRQTSEEAEAKRLAVEINRTKRINARAESLARLHRNET